MKLKDKPSIYNIIIYGTILILGLVFIGCSSEKDEEGQEEEVSPSVNSKEQSQKQTKKEVKDARQMKKPERIQGEKIYKKKQSVGDGDKDKDEASAVIAELGTAISTERKIELIESLSELALEEDLSVIGVVRKALDEPNPEVGRAAIELLEDYESPEILPVIKKALESTDEQTRELALLPLCNINDAEAGQLLAQALDDASEDVRTAALSVAEDHEDHIKLIVMEKGITCEYIDVKEEVISILEYSGDHSAVEILIMGLKDNDTYTRELIKESLDFLIDKEFESYEEAHRWWSENKANYDEELFLKEE